MTAPITDLYPFFEFDVFSEKIMENYGFVVTNFKMISENHGDRIIITADWNIPQWSGNDIPEGEDFGPKTPSGDFPNVKYCRKNGYMSSGGHQLAIDFFFPDLEAPEKSTYGYSDTERKYNGFGKISFDIGLAIIPESEVWKSNCPELGYNYSHSLITKYGVVVYFDKKRPGEPKPERVLFHYEDGEMKVGVGN